MNRIISIRILSLTLCLGFSWQLWAESPVVRQCNVEFIFEQHLLEMFRCLESPQSNKCLGDYVLLPPVNVQKTQGKFYEPTLNHQNRKDRRFIIEQQARRLKSNYSSFLSETNGPWYDLFYSDRTVQFENIERYHLNHYKVYIRNHKNPGRPGFVEMMRKPEYKPDKSGSDYAWYPKTEICQARQVQKTTRRKTAWRIIDLDGLLTAL